MSYLDWLPDELILEVFKFLKSESKKTIVFNETCKRVYESLLTNMRNGFIDPDDWFDTLDDDSISEEGENHSITSGMINNEPFGNDELNKFGDKFLPEKTYYYYSSYGSFSGYSFIIYQTDFIGGYKYYVSKLYNWHASQTSVCITYNKEWKNVLDTFRLGDLLNRYVLDTFYLGELMKQNGYF